MDKTAELIRAAPGKKPQGKKAVYSSGNRHIDELRAEIEKTRQETTRTINELERRLSPSNLIAQVREKTRQAVAGRRVDPMAKDTSDTSKGWGTALYDTIKSNPLPTMLVGGGLAWLIASGVRKEEEAGTGFIERRKRIGTDETGTYGLGFIDRRRSDATGAMDQAREKAGRVKHRLRSKSAEASGKVARWSDQVRARASQTGEQVRIKSQEWGSSAVQYGRRAQQSIAQGGRGFVRYVDSSPLAMAGVVMAAGAVLGLIIPETDYEVEKFGPQRQEVLSRARDMGREKVDQVEAVARESFESAKEAARQEADRQGLTPPREPSEEAGK